jgi:SAM-dependent methyltransferase
MTSGVCSICGTAHTRRWPVRELHFVTNDPFTYGECGDCGALELLDPPSNWDRYYPPEYYSFSPVARGGIKNAIRVARNRLALGGRGPVASLVKRFKPHAATSWLANTDTRRSSRILDVGCGAGDLLRDLAAGGFTSLLGVDRFIPRAIDHHDFSILKGSIDDIGGEFDLIMFHHSLEHMANPRDVLRAASERLAPDGWCIVRLPVVPCDAWERYREHWVQLEAPRHLFIHSIESLTRLGRDAGLSLESVDYDSTSFQFAVSELYRRGLPFDATDRVFSRAELRAFQHQAELLNAARRGDQATFYFKQG